MLINPPKKNDDFPQFPTKEEAHEIVNELLVLSGIHDPENTFEILDEPFNIVAPSELEGYAKQIPCYVAIAKPTGMVLLFCCTGQYGIFARFRRRQQIKIDHLD